MTIARAADLVFKVLSEDAAVISLLGADDDIRLYPMRLALGAAVPAATFHVVTDFPQGSLAGYTSGLRRVRVQIDAYALHYGEAHAVDEAVTAALVAAEDMTVRPDRGWDAWEADESGASGFHRASRDFFLWVVEDA